MSSHIGTLWGSLVQKRLPVFEMLNATVQKKRLTNNTQWGSLSIPHSDLTFTGYQLAHAVIKADFLQYRNPIFPSISFILQSHHIVDWSCPYFSLQKGGAALLNDFARTSLTGRIGQGLALLFLHSRGYAFTAHLRTFLEENCVSTSGTDGKSIRVADFVCDGEGDARAIVESKASFSTKRNDPSEVKSLLKRALNEQVIPWMSRLSPPASKSYVVSSYLREDSGSAAFRSALVFVDPENSEDLEEFEMSPATVRRQNYAAWLSVMGLSRQANRLRNRELDVRERTSFAVVEIANREIAFPVQSNFPNIWKYLPQSDSVASELVVGLDVEALAALSEATRAGDGALLGYTGWNQNLPDRDGPHSFSLFPDGTFVGSVPRRASVRFIEKVL